jgi:hypothetical protein
MIFMMNTLAIPVTTRAKEKKLMPSVLKRFMVFALLLLAGCAGPKYMNMASSLPALQPGQGRVFFYTPEDSTNTYSQPRIRLNREVVGRIKPGSFFATSTVLPAIMS